MQLEQEHAFHISPHGLQCHTVNADLRTAGISVRFSSSWHAMNLVTLADNSDVCGVLASISTMESLSSCLWLTGRHAPPRQLLFP